jgi:hypothetical protein
MFADRRIRKHGLPAEATVTSMTPRRYGGAEMSRKYDYVLEVRPKDRASFTATLTIVAAFLGAKPQEYDVLRVKYDPKTLKVLFDFTGDPRYETEAMNARTAQTRKETAAMLASRTPVRTGLSVVVGQSGNTAASGDHSSGDRESGNHESGGPEVNDRDANNHDFRDRDFSDHVVLEALRQVMATNPLVVRVELTPQADDSAKTRALDGIANLLENGLISGSQFEELQKGILAKMSQPLPIQRTNFVLQPTRLTFARSLTRNFESGLESLLIGRHAVFRATGKSLGRQK